MPKSYADRIVVMENETVETPIIPTRREELLRKVIIRRGAIVKGDVIGAVVEIEQGAYVKGTVLASDVVFNPVAEEGSPTVIEGDVAGFSQVWMRRGINAGAESSPHLSLFVKGNVYALRRIVLNNTIVDGNVIAPSIVLEKCIVNGLVMSPLMEGATSAETHISDTIMYTVLSEGSISLKGSNGVVIPAIYAERNTVVRGELYVIDPKYIGEIARRHIRAAMREGLAAPPKKPGDSPSLKIDAENLRVLDLFIVRTLVEKHMNRLREFLEGS